MVSLDQSDFDAACVEAIEPFGLDPDKFWQDVYHDGDVPHLTFDDEQELQIFDPKNLQEIARVIATRSGYPDVDALAAAIESELSDLVDYMVKQRKRIDELLARNTK